MAGERKEKAKFYSMKRIRAQNGNAVGRVDIYGIIDALQFWGDEITPSSFAADLNALGTVNEIEVHIFSHGGDMFASLAIYRELKSRPEKVTVYIEGIAASGGSIIACAGDVTYMPPEAMMFVHNLLTDARNINEHDARELVEEMVKLKEPMVNAYMEKCKKSSEEVIALLDGSNKKGTWLTAAEAIAFGLVDNYTPQEKKPLEAAAYLSPGVFNYKGHRIDCSCYDMAAEKTAGIINPNSGGIFMAFFNRKKNQKTAAKAKPKAEITFVEMVCPSCGGAVNMNPETGEIFAGGAQQVESQTEPPKGEEPAAVLARRMPGNVRAAIYSVDCPHCGNQFVWDTDINTDSGPGTATTPAVPLGGASTEPAQQNAEPKAAAAIAACPNCGEDVQYDPETAETGTDDQTGEEGYVLTCPSCNTQFIEPFPAAEPNAVPVGAAAQAAYQAGVMAERNRQAALDEMAMAAPAMAAMIQAAKKSGTSAETMSRNVIKAMAQGKGGAPGNAGAAQFAAALGKDLRSSRVNSIGTPAHAAAPKTVQASAYERRVEEHNKARRGEDNG
jgi:ATP-dependent Clp protease protease subunit